MNARRYPKVNAAARIPALTITFPPFLADTLGVEAVEGARLALQLRCMLISESLGHHDSEIMDGSWIGRGDAGAVGVVVAGRQGAEPAAVPAGTHGAIRGVFPGRSARPRAAQDGLEAGGSGG